MFNITGIYTDLYQLTMAQVYFLKGLQKDSAIFDYFFRELPFKGGYAIFAGLGDLLTILEQLRFTEEDIEFLQENNFDHEFINYLRHFQFKGKIYASFEGDLIFPTRPVLCVEANIIEAQIIETLILNVLNFQTLIATKARRIRQVAKNQRLIDFGLRRAQGLGGYWASRASIIGGFNASSNLQAAADYSIPIAGTMAHSFVQSYDSELKAFSDFAQMCPHHCVLLVDTYNTLQSGLPNAILVAKEMEKRGQRLQGIRLDSGDLAWLAKKCRQILNEAGLSYVEIVASNQLDEYVIENLINQGAPIDVFGIGTKLAIGAPDCVLDGVYKLAMFKNKPRIKLSETTTKISIPYQKQVYRISGEDGNYLGVEAIGLHTESEIDIIYHPFENEKSMSICPYKNEPLLHLVMKNGLRLLPQKSLFEIEHFSQSRFDKLPLEYKRFVNPHIYKIGLSNKLKQERDKLIAQCRK